MVITVNNTVLHLKVAKRINNKSPHHKKKNIFVTIYGDGW